MLLGILSFGIVCIHVSKFTNLSASQKRKGPIDSEKGSKAEQTKSSSAGCIYFSPGWGTARKPQCTGTDKYRLFDIQIPTETKISET